LASLPGFIGPAVVGVLTYKNVSVDVADFVRAYPYLNFYVLK